MDTPLSCHDGRQPQGPAFGHVGEQTSSDGPAGNRPSDLNHDPPDHVTHSEDEAALLRLVKDSRRVLAETKRLVDDFKITTNRTKIAALDQKALGKLEGYVAQNRTAHPTLERYVTLLKDWSRKHNISFLPLGRTSAYLFMHGHFKEFPHQSFDSRVTILHTLNKIRRVGNELFGDICKNDDILSEAFFQTLYGTPEAKALISVDRSPGSLPQEDEERTRLGHQTAPVPIDGNQEMREPVSTDASSAGRLRPNRDDASLPPAAHIAHSSIEGSKRSATLSSSPAPDTLRTAPAENQELSDELPVDLRSATQSVVQNTSGTRAPLAQVPKQPCFPAKLKSLPGWALVTPSAPQHLSAVIAIRHSQEASKTSSHGDNEHLGIQDVQGTQSSEVSSAAGLGTRGGKVPSPPPTLLSDEAGEAAVVLLDMKRNSISGHHELHSRGAPGGSAAVRPLATPLFSPPEYEVPASQGNVDTVPETLAINDLASTQPHQTQRSPSVEYVTDICHAQGSPPTATGIQALLSQDGIADTRLAGAATMDGPPPAIAEAGTPTPRHGPGHDQSDQARMPQTTLPATYVNGAMLTRSAFAATPEAVHSAASTQKAVEGIEAERARRERRPKRKQAPSSTSLAPRRYLDSETTVGSDQAPQDRPYHLSSSTGSRRLPPTSLRGTDHIVHHYGAQDRSFRDPSTQGRQLLAIDDTERRQPPIGGHPAQVSPGFRFPQTSLVGNGSSGSSVTHTGRAGSSNTRFSHRRYTSDPVPSINEPVFKHTDAPNRNRRATASHSGSFVVHPHSQMLTSSMARQQPDWIHGTGTPQQAMLPRATLVPPSRPLWPSASSQPHVLARPAPPHRDPHSLPQGGGQRLWQSTDVAIHTSVAPPASAQQFHRTGSHKVPTHTIASAQYGSSGATSLPFESSAQDSNVTSSQPYTTPAPSYTPTSPIFLSMQGFQKILTHEGNIDVHARAIASSIDSPEGVARQAHWLRDSGQMSILDAEVFFRRACLHWGHRAMRENGSGV